MAGEYELLVSELRAAQGKTDRATMVKSIRTSQAETGRLLKSMERAEAQQRQKAQAQAEALAAMKARFATFNSELTRMASTGAITAEQAATAEAELAKLGAVIQAWDDALPSGENANAVNRTRHGEIL